MKKRFTEEQIAYALRQAESGISIPDISRKMGISERHSTDGRRDMLEWEFLSCAS